MSARDTDGGEQTMQAVARVLGVDAAFSQRSAAPGSEATLVVQAAATSLTVQLLRSGPEPEPTYADDEIKGVPVGAPVEVPWTACVGAPGVVELRLDAGLASGVYAAQVTADDGRVGFAPLVVRPRRRGTASPS